MPVARGGHDGKPTGNNEKRDLIHMTATSYVENIVRQHLELYKDDINRIYKQKSAKNLI